MRLILRANNSLLVVLQTLGVDGSIWMPAAAGFFGLLICVLEIVDVKTFQLLLLLGLYLNSLVGFRFTPALVLAEIRLIIL